MLVKSTDLHLSHKSLFGCSEEHVEEIFGHTGIKMHRDVLAPLEHLMSDARDAGFDLRVASGFRSFERQRLIWNGKCRGERPVFDCNGRALDVTQLSVLDKIEAILHWSALPGASRHHWGTECDIYDAQAMPDGYQLQLHPDEYLNDGLFTPMMTWLETYLQKTEAPAFYRPYFSAQEHQYTVGVAPEPWHLSYRPVANTYEEQFSCISLKEYLQQLPSDHRIEEHDEVICHLESIFQRFISLNHSDNDNECSISPK